MNIMSKVLGALSPSAGISREIPDELVSSPQPRPITYLKIKIVSLADEAKRIRQEETKLIHPTTGRRDDPTRMGLMAHRKNDIRPEARCALLAYGYLRGRSYRAIEHKCDRPPNWTRIRDLIAKYGPPMEGKEATPGEHRRAILTALSKWSESA